MPAFRPPRVLLQPHSSCHTPPPPPRASTNGNPLEKQLSTKQPYDPGILSKSPLKSQRQQLTGYRQGWLCSESILEEGLCPSAFPGLLLRALGSCWYCLIKLVSIFEDWDRVFSYVCSSPNLGGGGRWKIPLDMLDMEPFPSTGQ